jgi:hypothetical protein
MHTTVGNNKPPLLYLQHVSAHLGYFPGVKHTKIASIKGITRDNNLKYDSSVQKIQMHG